eukprot:2927518-Ditylum_brightwellii.AAC.1
MFTTSVASSETDKIDIWKGVHKSSLYRDILGTSNDDTSNNESPQSNPTSQQSKECPLQAHLKNRIAESKEVPEDTDKDNNDTILSKGAPKEYNRTAKHDLSLLTKKIQSSLKPMVPTFQNQSRPSTRNSIVAKNKLLRQSKRIMRLSSKDRKLMALQAAASLPVNKKPNRFKFQKQFDNLLDLTSLSNGEVNEFHPLALVAGTKSNPNVLSHRDTMKSKDHEQFLKAMEEEIKE